MRTRIPVLLPFLAFTILVPLPAAEVPLEVKAKVLRILAASMGAPGKIYCKDPALRAELLKAGLFQETLAPMVYASTEAEVRSLKGTGRLVICGKVEWLAEGASVALVEEDNHPQIYFHMAHLATSPVTLSDSVLKIGKKL